MTLGLVWDFDGLYNLFSMDFGYQSMNSICRPKVIAILDSHKNQQEPNTKNTSFPPCIPATFLVVFTGVSFCPFLGDV
jgi:hypothetical protein